jgi:hypothetical protein
MLDEIAISKESITSIKDGIFFGEQWHVDIEVYLGHQRNLVWIETLYKHILPLKCNTIFREIEIIQCIFWWLSNEQLST